VNVGIGLAHQGKDKINAVIPCPSDMLASAQKGIVGRF